jgi:hypothetical protein
MKFRIFPMLAIAILAGFVRLANAAVGEGDAPSSLAESSIDKRTDQDGHALAPFVIEHPNRALSPYTGMDRAEWIACGKHILEGAFSYVDKLETPMLLPKFPGVTYPAGGNEKASQQQRSAAIFEAIARTFNIASPLIAADPNIEIHGIKLADYYKYHLLKLITDRESPIYIGDAAKYKVPVQQTCELGNLSTWMILQPQVFWDRLSKAEQDAVAKTLGEWAASTTNTHNWRWFNVMMMTFLDLHGYPIDRQLMRNHLDTLLLHHAGDGWYRDTGYDYYSIHVFALSGQVWSRYYGREHEPARAALIDQTFGDLMKTYPMIFGRDGQVMMFGRSTIYRLGAAAAIPAAFLGGGPERIAPGLARRIASGSLLQFVTHPAFFNKGIPSLGFYGPFEPAVPPAPTGCS